MHALSSVLGTTDIEQSQSGLPLFSKRASMVFFFLQNQENLSLSLLFFTISNKILKAFQSQGPGNRCGTYVGHKQDLAFTLRTM